MTKEIRAPYYVPLVDGRQMTLDLLISSGQRYMDIIGSIISGTHKEFLIIRTAPRWNGRPGRVAPVPQQRLNDYIPTML